MKKYEWDEAKRLTNIKKHGIDFVSAAEVFEQPHVVLAAKQQDEDRWIALGPLGSRCIAVVFTMRGPVIRVISARVARAKERQVYEAQINRTNPPNGGPH